jgi:hypothetical protein
MTYHIYRPVFVVTQRLCGKLLNKSFNDPKKALQFLREITELCDFKDEQPHISIRYLEPGEMINVIEQETKESLKIDQGNESCLQGVQAQAERSQGKGGEE